MNLSFFLRILTTVLDGINICTFLTLVNKPLLILLLRIQRFHIFPLNCRDRDGEAPYDPRFPRSKSELLVSVCVNAYLSF